MRVAIAARALAAAKSWASGSPSRSSAAIMRLRSAARDASAISRRRVANHSTCCSFIRSHGGLPITASKPPVRRALSQFVQTPGNAACQLRKRSSAMSRRASRKCSTNRAPSARSVETSALPNAISMGSPSRPLKKACSASLSCLSRMSSQSKAWTRDRNWSSGFVIASTSAKPSADRCASPISASVKLSTVRMLRAACIAALIGGCRRSGLSYSTALSMPVRIQAPNKLSPQRRW